MLLDAMVVNRQSINKTSFSAIRLFSCTLLLWVAFSSMAWSQQNLVVGVYQNPPSVFYDEAGKVQGFYIDVLEHIAALEGWQLEYHKATWPELIENLDSGKIDMIAGMAFSAERDRLYDFTTEPVFINWGQVYVRDTSIQSLLDLTNRKVVGLKEDIYTLQFQELLDQFALPVKLIEVSSYEDIISYVESGKADAGITSRSNGQRLEGLFEVHRSPIVCCSREVHYSVKEGQLSEVLRALDHHLQELKSRNDSFYFTSLDHWFAEQKDTAVPTWVVLTLAVAIGVVVVLAILSMILRRQVRERTNSLQEAYKLMESRVQERTQELSERNNQLLDEIYEHRKTQEKLQYMVRHDPLTSLPNRRWFSEQLEADIKTAHRSKQTLAVMFLDLDGFKEINDSHGHDFGDLVLVSAAERCKDCLRDSDKIARLGGDEFIILLPQISGVEAVKVVAEKVLKSFSVPFTSEGNQCVIGVSIGISIYPQHGTSAESLLTRADEAMLASKRNGRNQYTLYNNEKRPNLELIRPR